MSFTVYLGQWGAVIGAGGGFSRVVDTAANDREVEAACALDSIVEVAQQSIRGGALGGALGGACGLVLDVTAATVGLPFSVPTVAAVAAGSLFAQRLQVA